jgi:hypothetical protein
MKNGRTAAGIGRACPDVTRITERSRVTRHVFGQVSGESSMPKSLTRGILAALSLVLIAAHVSPASADDAVHVFTEKLAEAHGRLTDAGIASDKAKEDEAVKDITELQTKLDKLIWERAGKDAAIRKAIENDSELKQARTMERTFQGALKSVDQFSITGRTVFDAWMDSLKRVALAQESAVARYRQVLVEKQINPSADIKTKPPAPATYVGVFRESAPSKLAEQKQVEQKKPEPRQQAETKKAESTKSAESSKSSTAPKREARKSDAEPQKRRTTSRSRWAAESYGADEASARSDGYAASHAGRPEAADGGGGAGG